MRSWITNIIFRESSVYTYLLKFVGDYNNEINNINEYRNNKNLFKFYIKGNMALLLNLIHKGVYESLDDPKIIFEKSDVDTNLYINMNSKNSFKMENIAKSLSQKKMYNFRKNCLTNKLLIDYLNNDVVNIANNDKSPIKDKYNIKSIQKIKLKDTLMFKKKDFVSRWKHPEDDYAHNITVSFNENIEDFLLYRLFSPYLFTFNSGKTKIVNAELIDLSIVKITRNNYINYNNNIDNQLIKDINTVLSTLKILDTDSINYDIKFILWKNITKDESKYLLDIKYFDYKIPICSLYYLLLEYILIVITDPNDFKNQSKLDKIKLIQNILKN
jgi:hypothetical protein